MNWTEYSGKCAELFIRLVTALEEVTDSLDDALLTHIFDDEEEAAQSGYAETIAEARKLLNEARELEEEVERSE